MQTIIDVVKSGKDDRAFVIFFGQMIRELSVKGILPLNEPQIEAIDKYVQDFSVGSIGGAGKTFYDVGIQLFINYCAIIRNCNVTDKYGTVWRSTKNTDGSPVEKGFLLGLGSIPDKQMRIWLPIEQWDLCYFAKELKQAPAGEELRPDESLTFLMNLL